MTPEYFVKRTAQAVGTFVAVVLLSFSLIRLMPGGPMDYLKAQLAQNPEYSREQVNELIETYAAVHPEKPFLVQLVEYVTNILQGNLGTSMWYDTPVAEILGDAMPWTIFISVVSLLFIYSIGITLGAVMAYREGSKLDVSGSVASTILTSIPFYVLAVLFVWILAYQNSWFPTGGRVNPDAARGLNLEFVTSVLYHSALPVASLVIAGFGHIALSMRGNSIQVLGSDYLRVARLRGLAEKRISMRYVGRNAILPMYTSMMISIGSLFGGSIILEQIFAYPGIGYYMYQALSARDYPLLMGAFIFITAGVIFGVYLADLTYGLIDPRAGNASERESYGATGSLSIRAILGGLVDRLRGDGSPGDTSSAENVATNGARHDVSAFEYVSDTTLSRRERYHRNVDEWLVAPLRVLVADSRSLFGLAVLSIFVLAGTLGVMIIPVPRASEGAMYVAPFRTMEFPLGTDKLGRGIFGQLIHATPPMLKMVIAGALFSSSMATVWGTVAGYRGGRADRVMMSIADVVMTIPGLPLIVVIAAILEPENPFVVGIVLSVNVWAGFARSLRSQVLTIREESYVEASRTMGISTPAVITKDVLPNLMPLVMVNLVTSGRRVIISSVGLYFLGILPFSTLNWGVMMNLAYKSSALFNNDAMHWFLAPMVTIVVLSLGLILLGQGMDRIFNPRLRARHSSSGGSGSADDADETDEVTAPQQI